MTIAPILVVLPTLGERLETLQLSLQSIEDQRKDVDLKLVVVCPESAVEARRLALSFGAEIVNDPKKGISTAINAGVSAAEGQEFYAWMGDDDLFRPGALKTLISLLEETPDAVVSFGACEYIAPNGEVLGTSRAGKLARFILPWGPDLIPHPGSMIQISALVDSGLFRTDLKYVMDLEKFLALRKYGKFISTKTVVSAFRWHPESLTVAGRASSSAEAERVKKAFLPKYLRPFSFIWLVPIRWASAFAAGALNRRAIKALGG